MELEGDCKFSRSYIRQEFWGQVDFNFAGGSADQAGGEGAGRVYGPVGHTGKYIYKLDVLDPET